LSQKFFAIRNMQAIELVILMFGLFQDNKRKSAPISSSKDLIGFTEEQKEDLRELRAEIQDLQGLLDDISNGDTTLVLCKEYIEKTKGDIKAILEKFSSISQDNSRREELRRIKDVWEQMELNPIIENPGATFSAEDQLHYMNMLNKRIKKMVYLISYITIPERLNQWLMNARPGYYIPFHVIFEDELPSLDDRDKILEFLRYSPKALKGGLIHAGNGLVYCYSMSMWKRVASIFELLAIFVLATFLVYHSSAPSLENPSIQLLWWNIPLPHIAGWPISVELRGAILLGWIAIIFGIITHAAVGTAKKGQREGLPPIYATSDLSRYINAKFGLLVRKILLALIGLFGLMFASGADSVTALNAFLMGYSLDSVMELFGTSLEQKSAAQLATLKSKLETNE